MPQPYDIIIIGGGAAGFTAGLYAARDRCRALLLERFSAGGQVLNCEHIENYPGFPDGVAGYTLGPLLQQQATSLGLEMQLTEVSAVRRDGEVFVLQTDSGTVHTKALIIATGSSFSTLGVPGEEEFVGKGVSHCAACDGAFFMDQPVAVVGGGDAAIDEGLHLTQYASHVTVIHRRATLRACQLLQERAQANDKLSFCWNSVVRAIEGDTGVERIQLEDVTQGGTIHAGCRWRLSLHWPDGQYAISGRPGSAQCAGADCDRPLDADGNARRPGCRRCPQRFLTATRVRGRRWRHSRPCSNSLCAY